MYMSFLKSLENNFRVGHKYLENLSVGITDEEKTSWKRYKKFGIATFFLVTQLH